MTAVAIFGATSAIAMAVARDYAAKSARFCLVARDADKLEAVANDLLSRGAAQVVQKTFDFADTAALPELFEGVATDFGVPDRAVIAFGTLPDNAHCVADTDAAKAALAINFVAPALVLQELAKLMASTRGAIAVIGSVAGDRGRSSNYVYGAAKGGIGLFTQGLAHSLAHGPTKGRLSVSLIKPGFVDTPMTASYKKGALWASPEAVGGDIVRALESGKSAIRYTPWFWRWIMLIIRLVPQPIMHRTRL